jgi:3-oxoacyl-[acyl-carrier protein] reductase
LPHTSAYGPSKAELEMATEVWAKEVEGRGLTIKNVKPGANMPGMDEEMVPPLRYVVSREAGNVNGWRFDANLWDSSLPPTEAARHAGRPAGFEMHPHPG